MSHIPSELVVGQQESGGGEQYENEEYDPEEDDYVRDINTFV